MVFLIVILCLFNISLWIVFVVRFKKLFNTDSIIENTKESVNKILIDLNNNTTRNINLIEDRISKLKILLAEADKKIKLLSEQELGNAALKDFRNQVSSNSKTSYVAKHIADSYGKNKAKKNNSISAESSVVLTKTGENAVEKQSFAQNTLFSEDENSEKMIDTTATVNVTGTGASYAEIPVIAPKVFVSDKPVSTKNGLKQQIVDMFEKGYEIEQIASELSCSPLEVQFALTLDGKL